MNKDEKDQYKPRGATPKFYYEAGDFDRRNRGRASRGSSIAARIASSRGTPAEAVCGCHGIGDLPQTFYIVSFNPARRSAHSWPAARLWIERRRKGSQRRLRWAAERTTPVAPCGWNAHLPTKSRVRASIMQVGVRSTPMNTPIILVSSGIPSRLATRRGGPFARGSGTWVWSLKASHPSPTARRVHNSLPQIWSLNAMRKDIAHTATLVLSLSLAIEFSSAWARPGTDGKWTVKVITESGGCNQVSRYPVIIEDGRPRYRGPEVISVSGQVDPNGSVSGVISQFGGSAQVKGRLSGRRGSGTWVTSALGGCSGRWRATKDE